MSNHMTDAELRDLLRMTASDGCEKFPAADQTPLEIPEAIKEKTEQIHRLEREGIERPLRERIAHLEQMIHWLMDDRCPACGVILGRGANGCRRDGCSYRPERSSPMYKDWHARMKILAELRK